MRLAYVVVAGGILAAAAFPAFADTLTATVTAWNAQTRTITFSDKTQMIVDPALVPAELQPGVIVTVTYQSSENGVEKISEIVINK